MAPLVSVVMPVYNGAGFVGETVSSILNQSWTDFEFIIVDDGSTDATREILDRYRDPRIVRRDLVANQGVSRARNLGVALARGEFLAFCDADDLSAPERLRSQVEFLLAHPQVDVCGSDMVTFEDGREQLVGNPLTDREIKAYFFTGNCICQPSVCGRTAVFRAFPYDPAFRLAEDYELWTRMALTGVTFANLPLPLVRYRLHPSQATKRKGDLVDAASVAISTGYTLAFLDDPLLRGYAAAAELSLADFHTCLARLAEVSAAKGVELNNFRRFISLQYRKLDAPGLRAFVSFRRLAAGYGLDFPGKYFLNLLLLCLLPIKKHPASSLFDTLTKLKLQVPKLEPRRT